MFQASTSLLNRLSLVILTGLILLACNDRPVTEGEAEVYTEPITISHKGVSLTVDPNYGARITSLKYKGREVLQTNRDSAGLTWGSTAWTSPQADWNWPPPATFDTGAYTVRKVSDRIYIFTSALDSSSLLRLEKRFMLNDSGEVGLRYKVKNESGMPVQIAAWEVTRIPYGGRIEFPASDTVWSSEKYIPVELHDTVAVINIDDQITKPIKIYANLRDTMVRYYHEGLVFTKQTVITGLNQVAPGQAPLEVYLDPGKKFAEFELQGGLYTLQHGQSAALRVKWVVQEE